MTDLSNIGKTPAYLAKNLSDLPQVKHGFLTRLGGVSKGNFDSLNCALIEANKDDEANIRANWDIVCKSFGVANSRFFSVKQVHKADIHEAVGGRIEPEPVADAIVTKQKGLLIGVRTADCVPILLSNKDQTIIGAVHAGWPSTEAGIIQATIAKMGDMGAKPADIVASVGPAIGQDSYEVGKELMMKFAQQSLEYSAYFRRGEREDHYMFNLSGLAAKILHNSGVRNIEHLNVDTYANEDQLFSHRRNTHQGIDENGRQLSAIMIAN